MRRLGKQTHEDPLQWLRNDVFTSSGGLLNKRFCNPSISKLPTSRATDFSPDPGRVTKRFKIKDFKERGAAGKYQTHFWGVNIQKKCPAKKSHWKSDSMKRKKKTRRTLKPKYLGPTVNQGWGKKAKSSLHLPVGVTQVDPKGCRIQMEFFHPVPPEPFKALKNCEVLRYVFGPGPGNDFSTSKLQTLLDGNLFSVPTDSGQGGIKRPNCWYGKRKH